MSSSSQARVGQFAMVVFAFALAASLARANDLQVCFTPPLPEGCDATTTVVEALDAAQKQVLVQAWGLVSAPIAQALVQAERRVRDVRVILDKSALRRRHWHPSFLEPAGVLLLIDAEHAIAHSNIIIVDRRTVITGSFNFSRAAQERNAEDLVVIHSPTLAVQYVRNWNSHAAHSQPVRTEANTNFQHQGTRADVESADGQAPAWSIVESCRSLDSSRAVGASPRADGARAAGWVSGPRPGKPMDGRAETSRRGVRPRLRHSTNEGSLARAAHHAYPSALNEVKAP